MSYSACFVSLLVALSAAAPTEVSDSWLCAPGCSCSQDGLSAVCDGVTPDPATLPPDLVALRLRAHQLRIMRNDTFAALPALEELDLSNGRISEVMADAFSTLPLLRSLGLRNNELTYLPADAFAANPALEELDVSSNPLVLPSIGPFLRSASLRDVSFAECMLRRFTPDTFAQLPSLRHLDLLSNAFSQLPQDAVQPFANLSWIRVDSEALSAEALTFLKRESVHVEVVERKNNTIQTQPEEQPDAGTAIFAGFLDTEYHYEQDADGENYGEQGLSEDDYDRELQWWLEGQLQTGTVEMQWRSQRQFWVGHPSWKLVLYLVLLVTSTCVTAALAYWATVLVIRRRSAAKAAQTPRDTLGRAFRQVARLPANHQLQRQPDKASSSGQRYQRLYDEEDGPASLPPRADHCTCLSCSEPVPTQPCIRFYDGPASVHGAVPSQYYRLYQ